MKKHPWIIKSTPKTTTHLYECRDLTSAHMCLNDILAASLKAGDNVTAYRNGRGRITSLVVNELKSDGEFSGDDTRYTIEREE